MQKDNKFYKFKSNNNHKIFPGDPSGSPDESFFSGDKNNETLVFIDEGFLSKLSRYFGKGTYHILMTAQRRQTPQKGGC